MGTLGFVLGTAAMDHEQVLVDQLADQIKTAPLEDTFYYLVPNHIKFETEINVLAGLRKRQGLTGTDRFASSRVQVLSFSRLAWYLLRDTAAFQTPRISKIGMAMLTSQVVQEQVNDLRLYASEVRQPGFIQKMTAQLEELKSANITADDLTAIISRVKSASDPAVNQAWLAKMHDVEIIYHVYEDRLKDRFLGNSELYQQLVAYLRKSPATTKMHFFIDRFAKFTANEQQVVDALITNAASTTISLTLDRGYPDQNHPSPSELPPKNDLFYSSAMQFHRLWKFAQAHPQDVKVLNNVTFATNPRVSPTLQQVDTYFKRYAREPISPNDQQELIHPQDLQFMLTTNRMTELNNIATQIHQLVASGKYRYRDFLILSRHLAGYQTMIDSVFAAHKIPIFNDHERQMDNHPLVTLLTTLIEIPQRGYRTADIIQLLKTWLLVPRSSTGDLMSINQFQAAVFTTENWCLKQAIEGKNAWITSDQEKIKQLWQAPGTELDNPKYAQSRLKKLNDQLALVKNYVARKIMPFFEQLKQAQTGKDLATTLYQFLSESGVTERLYAWQQYQSNRNLDLARQPQQVWTTFCQILQEYVEILGQQEIRDDNNSALMFSELLQAGFAAAQYSQIPATLDQVVISETGIVQSQSRKIVFMIGATDDVMPEMQESESLLTDQDKDILSAYLDQDFQYLPGTAIDQLIDEPFVHYTGFMNAKERLIFSAPRTDSDDKELGLSPYMRDMAHYFAQPCHEYPLVTSKEGQEHASAFVSAPFATINRLVEVGRQVRDDQGVGIDRQPVLPIGWQDVVEILVKTAKQWQASPDLRLQAEGIALGQRLALVAAGFHYQNKVDSLGNKLAQALYLRTAPDKNEGRVLYASISQLQDFYINQYEYFLKYGLRLQKRDELTLSTDRIGTFFHKAMESFVTAVRKTGLSFAALAKANNQLQRDQLIDHALVTAQENQPMLLRLINSSAQAQFQYQQLTSIVKTMLITLCRQAEYTGSQPLKTEVQFGRIGSRQPNDLGSLDYPLKDRHHIYLRGRIDRIDNFKRDNQDFLTVVDYKSSNHLFDLTSAYYGISLQLLTYLNGLQANLGEFGTNNPQLAGALYLRLNNPTVKAAQLKKDSLDNLKLKEHQYKGILLNDPKLLRELDKSLDKQAFLYPLKEFKNGKIKANKEALLVTPQQLEWLQEMNKSLVINAGNQILSGELKLNPYRLLNGTSRRTGLDFSDFLDVFQFDNMLDQQNYRDLNPNLAKEAFENVSREGEEDED
ncbi:PD-(D/E)XK nuclease family protein [Limosilactobacillus sp. STM2_1]|uniref:ATP-dependent helicase/deoxyribonuclease subunit B n=1 Tax=Limosilactobacillus rudii TaxID=2759755 RepID=A0A7W3UKC3_9LACO|nr:PD-(D/E)XK nuclease family protein [Limosilactobacillus rudii]MBB1078400.1 PD-(D/E)XK nuclease family protein [Limosilactobacillus rudii]MBB1096530.1 PD-(D/E)XK nuclease family protein [Limosilactobacillus rudii]MCD7134273.1 PD-(D/E)XK nuclease family protein [Limosilactobacillus rudii]